MKRSGMRGNINVYKTINFRFVKYVIHFLDTTLEQIFMKAEIALTFASPVWRGEFATSADQ
jgi:hypothetical protein